MEILFVGGTFDDNGGKPSGLVTKFYEEIVNNYKDIEITMYNGGHYDELNTILLLSKYYDVVFWWPNVPNDKEKIRNVKEINPKAMLISSKRNDDNKYSFPSLINRALGEKSNLVVEFSSQVQGFRMIVFDPLGTVWYRGYNVDDCVKSLMDRLTFLKGITRMSATQDTSIIVPDQPEFFEYVKNIAEVFHKVIPHDEEITRFLGNSSFRCQRGFPSFRGERTVKGDIVYVSRRNVDKRFISKEEFVPTYLDGGFNLKYYGDNKPSVDSPIQLFLYRVLRNINYMVHAHCYVKNAPFTKKAIPCGGLEEIDEILAAIKELGDDIDKNFYAINLRGHGCTIMSSDVEKLKQVEFISRDVPEYID